MFDPKGSTTPPTSRLNFLHHGIVWVPLTIKGVPIIGEVPEITLDCKEIQVNLEDLYLGNQFAATVPWLRRYGIVVAEALRMFSNLMKMVLFIYLVYFFFWGGAGGLTMNHFMGKQSSKKMGAHLGF